VEQGWTSLTPLRLDLTDERTLGDVRARLPLDDALARAISPETSSPEAAQSVRDDEADVSLTKTAPAAAGRAT
jgi:predicted component of type VI protein secretion system